MPHDREYYRWLINNFVKEPRRIGNRHAIYQSLLEQMSRKEFYFVVRQDENRAADGIYLRDRFMGHHPHGSVPEGPCTFLEFLIGVSIQLEEMLIIGEPLPYYMYFWELVNRLELDKYTDDTYSYDNTPFVVDSIMTNFMDRNYCRDGTGGLFPLKRSRRDQRRVEIWYQLNAYIDENPAFFT